MKLTACTRVKLRDGNEMPLFGLGCWAMYGQEAKHAVEIAMKCGYKMIDTAAYYKNESECGSALKEISRQDVFVVTKLDMAQHGYESTKSSFLGHLKELDLEYVDLFLIHSPTKGKIVDTWKAMIELRDKGLIKSIGVSNFNIQHLKPLKDSGLEVPAVNQFEFHPWLQQREAFDYCQENGIAVMGYTPLARGQNFEDGKYPILDQLCKKYGKSKAQIVLRWSLQRQVITIPKSSNPNRIQENINIYDFELTNEEMNDINGMNENRRATTVTAMSSSWTG